MVTDPQTEEDQKKLNERLRSLQIDRTSTRTQGQADRVPKKLLLALSAVVAVAALGYLYFFSATKTISAAEVKLESNVASGGSTVLSVSGYVVAHHKIAVGAKVM